jgi:hypothetical protein
MYVVKFPSILSLTIKMPTGVDFARVWTPVWILTSHWIVLNVKLKLILWYKISPRRTWRLGPWLCLWFVQIIIVLRSLQNSISESHGRMLFDELLRALRTLREFEHHNKLVRDMCVKLGNRTFGSKLHSLRPGHKSFWNFTKIVKNKCRMTVYRILFSRICPVYLSYVYNSCIKLWYFPKIWKHASVIPIPKPGKDHSNPINYRPIMSSISKVFKFIILKRLNGFISPVNILHDHQFGFRVAHSTSHQLSRVVRHVKTKRYLRVPESTGMFLLDVEKAFDSVWHEALIHKLLVNGCDIFLARLIFSFLKNC